MTFEEILDQAIAMLQRRRRLTYGTLKRQFELDDAALEDLKAELIEGQRVAVDEDGRVLVWTGDAGYALPRRPPASSSTVRAPLTYTPSLSRREDPDVPQCPGRRAQAGHGAVCRPQRLDGIAGRA